MNNNGFILKPEMYSQKEWYDMYIKVVQEYQEKDKEIDRLNNIINELDAMFDGDLDGFFTINEKGSCDEIIEVIQNYKDKIKELKENKDE